MPYFLSIFHGGKMYRKYYSLVFSSVQEVLMQAVHNLLCYFFAILSLLIRHSSIFFLYVSSKITPPFVQLPHYLLMSLAIERPLFLYEGLFFRVMYFFWCFLIWIGLKGLYDIWYFCWVVNDILPLVFMWYT